MKAVNVKKIIGPYRKPQTAFHPYDPRTPEVAGRLKTSIKPCMSDITIEHIDTTAVPGCPGQGVVDLATDMVGAFVMSFRPDNISTFT